MRRLAIIPNDPIDEYLKAGYGASWLKAYFNPAGYFDEVFSLAPYEQVDGSRVGVTVLPTPAVELPRRLRQLNINVVRAYSGSYAADIACGNKVSGIPVIASIHDTSPGLLHASVRDADVVLCVSEAVRRLAAGTFAATERLWILPNRVDFSVMRPRTPQETAHLDAKYPFKYRILHVGRRSKQKNLDNLLRALRLVGPDYCLIAAGRGPLEEYTQQAAQEGVLNRCFFLDAIANEDLPLYFSWASCMCNPSRWEGMSIVLIEALASGAILVVSSIPEIAESVSDRENGLLVQDYENPEAIAAAIRTACTDNAVRDTLKANARRSVERFERSRIDALEAGYYDKTLQLSRAGAFAVPLGQRIRRSVRQRARQVVPEPLRAQLNALIGR